MLTTKLEGEIKLHTSKYIHLFNVFSFQPNQQCKKKKNTTHHKVLDNPFRQWKSNIQEL